MSHPLPSSSIRTASIPVEFFSALRACVPAVGGADNLRDAGFQAGQALFDVFGHWLSERGERRPEELSDDRFGELASEFFASNGWGSFSLTTISEAVVAVDAHDWIEAEISDGSGCQVSTGMFAGFFGRIADAPMAVLEVECGGQDDPRCRFLIGSIDVLSYVHEAMGRGIPYERASASA